LAGISLGQLDGARNRIAARKSVSVLKHPSHLQVVFANRGGRLVPPLPAGRTLDRRRRHA